MSYGNKVIVTPDPRGVRLEGKISGTPAPGTVMEVVPATALDGTGRATFRVFQRGSDGQRTPIIVAIPNPFNGQQCSDAYANNDHGFFYCPRMGDELNMLIADVAGTGDTHAVGDFMIVKSGTGKLIVTTGTPQSEPFMLLEAEAAPTADTYLLAMYTGY